MGLFLRVVSAALVVTLFTKDAGAQSDQDYQIVDFVEQDLVRPIESLQKTVLDLAHILSQHENVDPLTKECPTPFTNIIGQCFYISTSFRLNFDDARKTCEGMGADLAQPKYPQALRLYIFDTLGGTKYYWIGGSDREEEGTWRWLSGGTLSGEEITTYWNPYEPNNDGSVGEDCLLFSVRIDDKQPFFDVPCTEKKHFICEYRRSN